MTDRPDDKQTTVASNIKYNNNNINNTIPIKVSLKVAPPRDKSKDFVQDYYMMSTALCYRTRFKFKLGRFGKAGCPESSQRRVAPRKEY